MTDLPDVNVWLALVDENHVHHARAVRYWKSESAAQIAFCRVTMFGFLRLSTHPKVLSRPLNCEEAWDIYHRYRSEADVVYLDDSASIDSAFRAHSRVLDFKQHLWTDAYLAAFTEMNNCRIVSFDADFYHFAGLSFLHLVTS